MRVSQPEQARHIWLLELGYILKGIYLHTPRGGNSQRPACDLPDIVNDECRDLLAQITENTNRISIKTRLIKQLSSEAEIARRLQTIPGVGPMMAMAIEAFAPVMDVFKKGRALAAWLGPAPRQFSSGGKERLGRVSKAGQADIRRLLIVGAMSRLNWLGSKSILPGSAISDVGAEAENAGCNSSSEQDGANDLECF